MLVATKGTFKKSIVVAEVGTQVWKKFIDRYRYKKIYRWLHILVPADDGAMLYTLSDARLVAEECHNGYLVSFRFRRLHSTAPENYALPTEMWP